MTDNHYNQTALPEVAVINVGEPVDAVFSYDKWRIRVYSNDPNPPRFHITYQAYWSMWVGLGSIPNSIFFLQSQIVRTLIGAGTNSLKLKYIN